MINVTIKIDSDMNTMQLDKIKQFLIEVQEILRPAPDTESAFGVEDAKDNMLAFAFLDRIKNGGTVRTEQVELLALHIRHATKVSDAINDADNDVERAYRLYREELAYTLNKYKDELARVFNRTSDSEISYLAYRNDRHMEMLASRYLKETFDKFNQDITFGDLGYMMGLMRDSKVMIENKPSNHLLVEAAFQTYKSEYSFMAAEMEL